MSTPSLKSLASVAAERPLTVGEALGVLRDAARALDGLHRSGRVHGAVCLENIVVNEAGAVRLCKDTLAPPGLSPEQEGGEEPDARSDVYGLGAAMVGLLGVARPVPAPLERMVATMMAERPEDRYRSMGEVLVALEACELLTGCRALRVGGEAEAARTRRWLLYAGIVALGVLMVGLGILIAVGRPLPRRGEEPESYKGLVERLTPVGPKPGTSHKPLSTGKH